MACAVAASLALSACSDDDRARATAVLERVGTKGISDSLVDNVLALRDSICTANDGALAMFATFDGDKRVAVAVAHEFCPDREALLKP